jgi:hypothetical protein
VQSPVLIYFNLLYRLVSEAIALKGHRNLHHGRYKKILPIITSINIINGIIRATTSGVLKNETPKKGLIVCKIENVHNKDNIIAIPKNAHRIMLVNFEDISTLNFLSFCFLTFDLKLILEIISSKAPC